MRISDIYGNNSITGQGRGIQGQETTALGQSTALSGTGERALSDLTPGKVIRGELVSTENGQVQIKLSNDTLVNARLDQNIALEPGKAMNFQVRSNGQTLMLTPLQANLSVDGPVTRALEMANLPVNSATGELTKLMMEAGLPIDRNHLQQFYREMIHQPTGQISDLVDLHRLGLSVTEDNLNQIGSYKNLTHQLMSGLEETSARLFETVSQMRENDPLGAAELFRSILEQFGRDAENSGKAANVGEDGSQNVLRDGMIAEGGETDIAEAGQLNQGTGEGTKASLEDLFRQTMAQIKDTSSELMQAEGADPNMRNISEENLPFKEQLANTLQNLLQNENYTEGEKIDFVSQLLKQGVEGQQQELTKVLLDSPLVKKLLSDQLEKQWTITPEQVQDPKEVENLYSRLERQLRGIANALEQSGQSQSPAFQSCENMNQNLDFLNQLNQMYAYVQLPLRLQQGEAHGDLYVYTNKKNLAAKDGPITALLHLDMEHLGPMDIYVTMQESKVGTNFTVANEEILDFLEEHMELLTARLEKRGYQLSVHTSVKSKGQEENSGIAPILEKTKPGYLIQTTKGFDVRT